MLIRTVKNIIILSCLLIISISAFPQSDSIEIADGFIENEDFNQAIELYQKILAIDSTDAVSNFKLGFCFMNTPFKKQEAITYFLRAKSIFEHNEEYGLDYIETCFYLGRIYRILYNPEQAIKTFEDLRKTSKNKKLNADIEKEIKTCKLINEFTQNPIQIVLKNLGDSINSLNSDHSPVLSADESMLFFTSRRLGSTGNEIAIDGLPYEDIYYSEKIGNDWSKPKNIGKQINTNGHEATLGISADGQELFIYRDEDEGSIFYSRLNGDQWTVPKKLGPTINTRHRETHASLSYDGKKLYFTSNRFGGNGGMDIYVSQLQPDSTWGEAKNLGPTVNTTEDEESPFIHPDNKTLFFSSKGHNGLGGFDIYKSELNQFKTWTMPENLGYPINTTEDDVFYSPTSDGQRAFFASERSDGIGKLDIYTIGVKDLENTNLTVYTGKAIVCAGSLPEATIQITSLDEPDVPKLVRINKKTGKFLFVASRGHKYRIEALVYNMVVFKEEILVPDDATNQQLYKTIRLDPEAPCGENLLGMRDVNISKDTNNSAETEDDEFEELELSEPDVIMDEEGNIYNQRIKIENIMFTTGKANAIMKNQSLDNLAIYLKRNPTAIVEIGAYADAKGLASNNQILTLQRSTVAYQYLLAQGVMPQQLTIVGYGEENPLAINKNPNGTWNLDAMKFNRRIEFRVIQQGASKLLISPVADMPPKFKNKHYDKKYKKNPVNIEADNLN